MVKGPSLGKTGKKKERVQRGENWQNPVRITHTDEIMIRITGPLKVFLPFLQAMQSGYSSRASVWWYIGIIFIHMPQSTSYQQTDNIYDRGSLTAVLRLLLASGTHLILQRTRFRWRSRVRTYWGDREVEWGLEWGREVLSRRLYRQLHLDSPNRIQIRNV